MLHESAARADEALCLNVEDLYPQDKSGKITAKGGATEWIHRQSGTAQLLPRLLGSVWFLPAASSALCRTAEGPAVPPPDWPGRPEAGPA
jgi:hypothetical protein